MGSPGDRVTKGILECRSSAFCPFRLPVGSSRLKGTPRLHLHRPNGQTPCVSTYLPQGTIPAQPRL